MMEVDGLFPILSCRQWESLIRKTRPMCIESFSTAWYIEWLALLKWLWVRALWSPLSFWLSGHSPSPLVSFRFVRVLHFDHVYSDFWITSAPIPLLLLFATRNSHFAIVNCLSRDSNSSRAKISASVWYHHLSPIAGLCPPHRAIPF